MDVGPFTLPNIRITRQVFRLLLMFLLFIFLASRFAWAEGIYDRVFARPELRIHQYEADVKVHLDNTTRFQSVVVVQNRGRQSASDVYVSMVASRGRITRYQIASEEAYAVSNNSNLKDGALYLTLPRLGPRASLRVYVWGSSQSYVEPPLMVAAIADSGAAKPLTESTALEESERYAFDLVRVFEEAYHAFRSHPKVLAVSQAFSTEFSDIVDTVTTNEHLTSMFIAALVLVALAWLFWSTSVLMTLISILATIFMWLFFDFSIAAVGLTAITIVAFIVSGLVFVTAKRGHVRSYSVALFLFAVLAAAFSYLLYRPPTLAAGWVSGSPLIGYALFILYGPSFIPLGRQDSAKET